MAKPNISNNGKSNQIKLKIQSHKLCQKIQNFIRIAYCELLSNFKKAKVFENFFLFLS